MKQFVEKFIATCLVCQQTKYNTTKSVRLLQPLPIPTLPWAKITMDFIVNLPFAYGYTTIFVVFDQ